MKSCNLHLRVGLAQVWKKKIQPNQKVQSTITVDGLKWILKQTSMSQKELSEKLDVSRQHINNILKGRSRISSKFSQKITEEFGYLFEEVSTKPCPTWGRTLPYLMRNPALPEAMNFKGLANALLVWVTEGQGEK